MLEFTCHCIVDQTLNKILLSGPLNKGSIKCFSTKVILSGSIKEGGFTPENFEDMISR